MTNRPCAIDGCDKPARARGWCTTHYQRWQRTGDPTKLLGRDNIVRRDANRHGTRRRYDWRQRGKHRVPATEVIAHLDRLVKAGWTKRGIQQAAGLGNSTIWHITGGQQATVNPRTAKAILALDPQQPPERSKPGPAKTTCDRWNCDADPFAGGRWCWDHYLEHRGKRGAA